MKPSPTISIVTQVYNTGAEVVEAMQSVLESSFLDWEHVLIDDASTDNSVELIESFCHKKNYPCVFVKHSQNLGIAKTRKEIISLARGKYIATLSDDLLAPKRLEKDVAFLEQCGEDVCGVFGLAKSFHPGDPSNARVFGAIEGCQGPTVLGPDVFAQLLLVGNPIPAVSMTLRSSWASNLPQMDSFFIEDYPQWVHLANNGCSFGHLPEITTFYRDSEMSVQKTHRSRVALDALKSKSMLLDNPHLTSEEVYTHMWTWFWRKITLFSSDDREVALSLVLPGPAKSCLTGLWKYSKLFAKKHLGVSV